MTPVELLIVFGNELVRLDFPSFDRQYEEWGGGLKILIFIGPDRIGDRRFAVSRFEKATMTDSGCYKEKREMKSWK